jgi:hypothetical protein
VSDEEKSPTALPEADEPSLGANDSETTDALLHGQGAEAQDPAPPPEPMTSPADAMGNDALFEALWKRVLDSWDEDKPHAAILDHAVRSEMLPELAGRYRAHKEVPGHEERAKKKLDALIVAATQMLMATKTEKAEKAPWQLTVGVALVCIVVLVWLAFKVLKPH